MSTAGPSRSPPRRTAALRVVEARPPGAARTSTAADSTVTDLQRAAARRMELARRADKWMDKMMEEVLTEDQFQRALSYIHASQYLEIEHERHLNHLCAYPLCPNAPTAAYRSGKRFIISSRARSITERSDNAHERFCSPKCAARSGWVAARLGTQAAWIRGRVERLELLEDLERRGDVRWDGRRGDKLVRCTEVKGLEGVPEVSGQATGVQPLSVASEAAPTRGGAPPGAAAATGRTPMASGATKVASPPGNATAPRRDRETAPTDPPATAAAEPAPVPTASTAPAGNTDCAPSSTPAPAPAGSPAPDATPNVPSSPPKPNTPPNTTPPTARTDSDHARVPQTSSARVPDHSKVAEAAADMATAAPGAHPIADLIANLTIVERATPAGRPAPPSAGGHTAAPRGAPIAGAGVERETQTQTESASTPTRASLTPNAQPQPQPQPQPSAQSSTQPARAPGRRAASSMISTSNTRLATAVLSASRQIPVPATTASDDESEGEEEWAKEMGWGEGDEVDALFEEARRARELVGEE